MRTFDLTIGTGRIILALFCFHPGLPPFTMYDDLIRKANSMPHSPHLITPIILSSFAIVYFLSVTLSKVLCLVFMYHH